MLDIGSLVSCRGSPLRQSATSQGSLFTTEAWSFFKLLDADAGGSVEIEEFLILGAACQRRQGDEMGKNTHDKPLNVKPGFSNHQFIERGVTWSNAFKW